MKLKKPKGATSNTVKPATVTTDQMPLKALHNNVNVLKIEQFHGNVAALKKNSTNIPIPVRSALLTPGGHIRRNDNFDKENDDRRHHDQDLSSDTLSMSELLSSSKVQGNSTKTSLEDGNGNAIPVVTNDLVDETSVTEPSNTEITPTNSPIRNRKRNRSVDGTPKLSTPPKSGAALDVIYNSKHRLTPSPRTQSNSSTPETPRSKANLNVLFNPKHRLTPSPTLSTDYTAASVNSNPMAQQTAGLYSTHSMNYLGPSNSYMRNFDHNLRSPKLLAQSNSQFSSVSDLREFAIKSSQSVISWPSQKLRTPSVKQFTIKNIGGRKLTMKIEVIGPGFQVRMMNVTNDSVA